MERGALILVAALALAACGGSEEEHAAPTRAAPPASTTAPPAASPPAASPALPAPATSTPPSPTAPAAASADPSRGAPLYAQYCASCHGPQGAGDGPLAQALDPKPAHHDDGAYMNSLSNDHLFQVVKGGGAAVGKSPLMTPWGGTLSDAQIWDVIAYVRTLARPPYTGPKP